MEHDGPRDETRPASAEETPTVVPGPTIESARSDCRWWLPRLLLTPIAAVGLFWGGVALGLPGLPVAGVAVVVGWCSLLFLLPWVRLRAGVETLDEIAVLTAHLRDVVREERSLSVKEVIIDRDDPVGDLSRAVHDVLATAISTRIESSNLSRSMDHHIERGIKRATSHLTQAANTDPLTGLGNRRMLDERLDELFGGRRRLGEPLSMLVIDLDFFKPVNDILGHDVGDQCLVDIASILAGSIRACDCAVRLGGDEFVVVLPGLVSDDAYAVAERIASLAARLPWSHSAVGRPSLSIGLATVDPQQPANVDDLLRRADQALYTAKRGGRGQVSVDGRARAA